MLNYLHIIHRLFPQPVLDDLIVALGLKCDVRLPTPKLLGDILVKLTLPDRVRSAVPAAVAVTAVAGVLDIFPAVDFPRPGDHTRPAVGAFYDACIAVELVTGMASRLDLCPLPKKELCLVPSVLVDDGLAEILVAELFFGCGETFGLVNF